MLLDVSMTMVVAPLTFLWDGRWDDPSTVPFGVSAAEAERIPEFQLGSRLCFRFSLLSRRRHFDHGRVQLGLEISFCSFAFSLLSDNVTKSA